MFRAPARPSSGSYNCINSLWFYRWSVGGSSVVGHDLAGYNRFQSAGLLPCVPCVIVTVPNSKHTNPLHTLPSRFVLMASPSPCLDLLTYPLPFSVSYHLNIICSPVRSHACCRLRQSYPCSDNLNIFGEKYKL